MAQRMVVHRLLARVVSEVIDVINDENMMATAQQ